MKKGILLNAVVTLTALFGLQKAVAQTPFDDVQYWVGSGTDSALLVVDFLDNTWDTCYVWGVRFDGTTTGEDMLNLVAGDDVNFSVNIGGGFLNDIYYGSHLGEGSNPNFWGTWSGTAIANLASNSGIGEVVNNGDIFGCSYTDFSPAIAPGDPIPAFDPSAYTVDDPVYWVGSGSDTAILVVDFLDGNGSSSFAWGYLFDGVATGEDMLNAVAAADPLFSLDMGSFLNDIDYDNFSGIGGSPNYWGTWTATNLGNWEMNAGISTVLSNGDFFGCSYTDFSPAKRPGAPQSAADFSSTENWNDDLISVYPNPATDQFSVQGIKDGLIKVWSTEGRLMYETEISDDAQSINMNNWQSGIYLVEITESSKVTTVKIIKQ